MLRTRPPHHSGLRGCTGRCSKPTQGQALLAQLQRNALQQQQAAQAQQDSLAGAQLRNAAGSALLARLQQGAGNAAGGGAAHPPPPQQLPHFSRAASPGDALLAQFHAGMQHAAPKQAPPPLPGLAGFSNGAPGPPPPPQQRSAPLLHGGFPQQPQQQQLSPEARFLAELQRAGQSGPTPPMQQPGAHAGAAGPSLLALLQQQQQAGQAGRQVPSMQPHAPLAPPALPQQAAPSASAASAGGGGSFDGLWQKLQQQHAQEATAAPGQQRAAAQAPAGSLTETDFWRQLQGR